MADRAIARRYARAFIELADEQGLVEQLAGELERAVALFRAHGGDLFRALSNPVFTLEERRTVLQQVLPRIEAHGLTRNLLLLLLEKGRFEVLPEVVEGYVALADERAGRARVTVETAEPLTPQLEVEVRAALERLTGKQVVLTTRVDPALIGGMVARVGSRVYDASMRTRLHDLKHRLTHARVLAEA